MSRPDLRSHENGFRIDPTHPKRRRTPVSDFLPDEDRADGGRQPVEIRLPSKPKVLSAQVSSLKSNLRSPLKSNWLASRWHNIKRIEDPDYTPRPIQLDPELEHESELEVEHRRETISSYSHENSDNDGREQDEHVLLGHPGKIGRLAGELNGTMSKSESERLGSRLFSQGKNELRRESLMMPNLRSVSSSSVTTAEPVSIESSGRSGWSASSSSDSHQDSSASVHDALEEAMSMLEASVQMQEERASYWAKIETRAANILSSKLNGLSGNVTRKTQRLSSHYNRKLDGFNRSGNTHSTSNLLRSKVPVQLIPSEAMIDEPLEPIVMPMTQQERQSYVRDLHLGGTISDDGRHRMNSFSTESNNLQFVKDRESWNRFWNSEIQSVILPTKRNTTGRFSGKREIQGAVLGYVHPEYSSTTHGTDKIDSSKDCSAEVESDSDDQHNLKPVTLIGRPPTTNAAHLGLRRPLKPKPKSAADYTDNQIPTSQAVPKFSQVKSAAQESILKECGEEILTSVANSQPSKVETKARPASSPSVTSKNVNPTGGSTDSNDTKYNDSEVQKRPEVKVSWKSSRRSIDQSSLSSASRGRLFTEVKNPLSSLEKRYEQQETTNIGHAMLGGSKQSPNNEYNESTKHISPSLVRRPSSAHQANSRDSSYQSQKMPTSHQPQSQAQLQSQSQLHQQQQQATSVPFQKPKRPQSGGAKSGNPPFHQAETRPTSSQRSEVDQPQARLDSILFPERDTSTMDDDTRTKWQKFQEWQKRKLDEFGSSPVQGDVKSSVFGKSEEFKPTQSRPSSSPSQGQNSDAGSSTRKDSGDSQRSTNRNREPKLDNSDDEQEDLVKRPSWSTYRYGDARRRASISSEHEIKDKEHNPQKQSQCHPQPQPRSQPQRQQHNNSTNSGTSSRSSYSKRATQSGPIAKMLQATDRRMFERAEQDWHAFENKTESTDAKGSIRYTDIPFPESQSSLISITMNHEELKKHFRILYLRWHPDKWMQRFDSSLHPQDRNKILEKVNEVAIKINQARSVLEK